MQPRAEPYPSWVPRPPAGPSTSPVPQPGPPAAPPTNPTPHALRPHRPDRAPRQQECRRTSSATPHRDAGRRASNRLPPTPQHPRDDDVTSTGPDHRTPQPPRRNHAYAPPSQNQPTQSQPTSHLRVPGRWPLDVPAAATHPATATIQKSRPRNLKLNQSTQLNPLYPRRLPPPATPPNPHRERPPEHPPGPHNRQDRARQAPSQSPHGGCTQSSAPAPSMYGDDDRQTTTTWNQPQSTLGNSRSGWALAHSGLKQLFRDLSRYFGDFSRYTARQISVAAPVGTTHQAHGAAGHSGHREPLIEDAVPQGKPEGPSWSYLFART